MRDQRLIQHAKSMRKNATPAEQMLWLELRAKRFAGAKFRGQVVVDRYIADFACRSPLMLAIEIDGDTHSSQTEYDSERTRFLESRGYRDIRFNNSDVTQNLNGVLHAIEGALTSTTSPSPNPLP